MHSDILNYTKLAFNSLKMIKNDTVYQPIKQGWSAFNLKTGGLGAVLLTVGRSYVGNDVTHSTTTLLDRAGACSYENLPKYRSYRVSNTAPWSCPCPAPSGLDLGMKWIQVKTATGRIGDKQNGDTPKRRQPERRQLRSYRRQIKSKWRNLLAEMPTPLVRSATTLVGP